MCAYVILVKPKLNENLNIPHGKNLFCGTLHGISVLYVANHIELLSSQNSTFFLTRRIIYIAWSKFILITLLSFVLEQTFCQVYIWNNVSFSESCLHTHRRFLEKFLSLAIFRDPLLFQEQCCLIWGFCACAKAGLIQSRNHFSFTRLSTTARLNAYCLQMDLSYSIFMLPDSNSICRVVIPYPTSHVAK